MAKAEKICKNHMGCKRHTGKGERRHLKRLVRRLRRRAEKRDPENAGTRLRHFIRGWLY